MCDYHLILSNIGHFVANVAFEGQLHLEGHLSVVEVTQPPIFFSWNIKMFTRNLVRTSKGKIPHNANELFMRVSKIPTISNFLYLYH